MPYASSSVRFPGCAPIRAFDSLYSLYSLYSMSVGIPEMEVRAG